jgi:hypothetical protein
MAGLDPAIHVFGGADPRIALGFRLACPRISIPGLATLANSDKTRILLK